MRDCVQDPGAVPAQVVAIENLSGTVKGLKLRVEQKIIDGGLHFKPGQWLDFFISGQEQVRNQNQNTSYNSNLNSPLRPGWRFLHVEQPECPEVEGVGGAGRQVLHLAPR